MLGKLMKHELKATLKLLLPLYLILLVISIVNRFVVMPSSTAGNFRIIDQFLTSIYIISIFVVLTVSTLYMIIRFYKNLLTDEGYLMFTLPVKPHQHITAKLLITLFWTVISIIAVCLSGFIVFADAETLPLAVNGIREAIASLSAQFGAGWVPVSIELAIMAVLGMVGSILMIYVSMALGQLFSKHKIIGSFIAYTVIYTAIQILGLIAVTLLGAFTGPWITKTAFLPQVVLPVAIVVLAIGCACCFLATNYIFKRKLNLD